jgi:anti-anti-sigma factor
MAMQQEELQVYEAGKLTVLGFGGRELLDHIDVVACRDQILNLVEEHECEVLAFDMTGVKLIPSGLLGIITSLRNLGVELHVYNPSDNVRDVLATTKLDELLQLHEVEI